MVEINKVTDKIDLYRAKYSEFFSVVQDDYLDKKSKMEEEYGYNLVGEDTETFCVDKDKMEEFEQGYTKTIVNIFDNIKEKDKNNYKFLVSLMYHDYMMLLEYYGDQFEEDEIEEIEELEFEEDVKLINSFDDLENYLEGNPQFYLVLFNYLIQFSDLNYYDVRNLYYKNSYNDEYLSKMFPCHIIDKLYFTRTITPNDLVDEFEKGETIAMREIVEKLRALKRFDNNNYEMLMNEMLENFYKNVTYKRSKGIHQNANVNLITIIEQGDIDFLKKNIVDEYYSMRCIALELYNNSKIYDSEYKKEAEEYYQKNCQDIKRKILKK